VRPLRDARFGGGAAAVTHIASSSVTATNTGLAIKRFITIAIKSSFTVRLS